MTEEFLGVLEAYLEVKCVRISLSELWSQTAPEDVRGQPLVDFLRGVSRHSLLFFTTPYLSWKIFQKVAD